MTERKPERYRHHPDMDRSTAGDRVPIGGRRHEFAEGVTIGYGDSEVHLPPRPRRPSDFELALERRAAYWERQRRLHVRVWKGIGWACLVLGAVLMVAITHG